jgi:DNA-binding CsgD family transcriptional regulator
MALNSVDTTHAIAVTEGIILADASLRPVALDRGAASLFRPAQTRGRGEPPVAPEDILQAFRGRIGSNLNGSIARFRIGKQGYVGRAFLLEPSSGSPQHRLIAIHIERDVSPSDAVCRVATDYDLTDREKETLIGISRGLTYKEVAEQMNISPNTVKAFLRLIMIKMGVTHRGAIITKLLGYNGSDDHAINS